MCEKQIKIIAGGMTMSEVEINRMIYENLIIAKTIGFIALFLIICIVLTQVYDYLKTRPHNRKQKKRFFYAGTYDDFMREDKK